MKLTNKFDNEFDYIIKERGKNYSDTGKVSNIVKTGKVYESTVSGSGDEIYNVYIDLYDEYFQCSCPYYDNCKHVYATMLEIDKGNYKSIKLMRDIHSKNINYKKIINKLSDKDIKEYLLSISNDFSIEQSEKFNEKFFEYLPKNTYKYYYNKFYNNIRLKNLHLIDKHYMDLLKYIGLEDYKQAFVIISALIDAMLVNEKFLELSDIDYIFSDLGIPFKKVYILCDEKLKNKINLYCDKLIKIKYPFLSEFINEYIIKYKK